MENKVQNRNLNLVDRTIGDSMKAYNWVTGADKYAFNTEIVTVAALAINSNYVVNGGSMILPCMYFGIACVAGKNNQRRRERERVRVEKGEVLKPNAKVERAVRKIGNIFFYGGLAFTALYGVLKGNSEEGLVLRDGVFMLSSLVPTFLGGAILSDTLGVNLPNDQGIIGRTLNRFKKNKLEEI